MKKNNDLDNFIYKAKEALFVFFLKNTNRNLSDTYPIKLDNKLIQNTDYTKFQCECDDLHIYLSQLYEDMVSKEVRKDYGKFYTKDKKVMNLMLSDSDVMVGKILEPACGTGIFLVEVIKRIILFLQDNNYAPEEIITYLLDNIYGIDIDKYALEIAEINILTEILPLLIEIKRRNPYYSIPKFNLTHKDFTDKNLEKTQFNLVIGNPPYVTLYGRRSRNMTEEKRAYYNSFDFVQNKKGNNKFNLSMFFLENGLKSLKQGGILYYILDISFFESAFIDLRRYIVKNYYIESIIKGLKAFEDVASGQVLIKVKNRKQCNHSIYFYDCNTDLKMSIEQKIWNDVTNKFKFYTPLIGIEKNIVDKIQNFEKLDCLFPNKFLRTCCALTGRTEDFIVKSNESVSYSIYPYIEGSKGLKEKFGALNAERYIKYDYELQLKISNEFKEKLEIEGIKNKKRVTLGDKEMYDAPKLFIRQSSSEIIATYTEKPYAANNSIYIMSNKDYTPQGRNLLKYICGVLNSDLITYFCRVKKIIRMEKGKIPQIKLSDLKEIRVCIHNEKFMNVVKTVDMLLSSPDNKIAKYNLNTLIYEIYDISSQEQEFINRAIR